MNLLDLKIIDYEGKIYIISNNLNFCYEVNNKNNANTFIETFTLNYALFTMYLRDDEIELKKYCRKNNITDKDEIEFCRKGIHASRKVEIKSDNKLTIDGIKYKKITSPQDIVFLRNNKKLRFLPLDIIKQTLKGIIESKAKWQKGLDITNLNWDREIVSQIMYSLFYNQINTNYTEEEIDFLKSYGGYNYQYINNFLSGELLPSGILNKDFLDTIIGLRMCMKPTPFDLYLHRATGSSHFLKNNKMIYSQFISTSIDYASIKPFRNKDIHEFYIPKGTPVIFKGVIEKDLSTENEIILPPMSFEIIEQHTLDYENIYKLTNGKELVFDVLILNALDKNRDNYLLNHSPEEYTELLNYAIERLAQLEYKEINNNEDIKEKENRIKQLYSYYSNLRLLSLETEKDLDKLTR